MSNKQAKELKPCPFCGGVAQLAETEGCDYVCACSECGVIMTDDMLWSEESYDARLNIIGKWNTRTNTGLEEAQAQVRVLTEMLDLRKEGCPNCDDVGWYTDYSHHTGEPEQVQCEFCYTNPLSVFNVGKALSSSPIATYQAERAVIEAANKVSDFVKFNEYPEPDSAEFQEFTRLLNIQDTKRRVLANLEHNNAGGES